MYSFWGAEEYMFSPDMNLIKKIASSPAPDARKGFNPFMAISYWVIDSHDNIIFGYPKDYVIQIYNPECKLIKKITREYDPVEVTEEEKEESKEDAPVKTRPQVWRKNKIYTIEEDEDEFHVVKRYRVNWSI